MSDIERIEKELSDLPKGWIVLVETGAEDILDVSLDIIKTLIDKNYTVVILSTSRPYSNLVSLYEKNNIDMKKIFVLDCVSKVQSADTKKTVEQKTDKQSTDKQSSLNNVLYLGSVADLTNISLSINEINEKIAGNKFVFIDSINTMLIHNKPDVFARFIHHILTKMRTKEISGLLLSLEGETNKEVRAEIAQLCDKVIKI